MRSMLPWCDRIGIVAVLICAAFTAIVLADGHYERLREAENIKGIAEAAFYIGGSVWLLLRALDFIVGGPWYRAHSAWSRPAEPLYPTGPLYRSLPTRTSVPVTRPWGEEES